MSRFFNFEDWFRTIDITDESKRDFLKQWLVSNDLNTFDALTTITTTTESEYLNFPDEQWATLGVKSSVYSALITIRNANKSQGKLLNSNYF